MDVGTVKVPVALVGAAVDAAASAAVVDSVSLSLRRVFQLLKAPDPGISYQKRKEIWW